MLRQYLNVYEDTISSVAGVKLPPFDIKDILNGQTGTQGFNQSEKFDNSIENFGCRSDDLNFFL